MLPVLLLSVALAASCATVQPPSEPPSTAAPATPATPATPAAPQPAAPASPTPAPPLAPPQETGAAGGPALPFDPAGVSPQDPVPPTDELIEGRLDNGLTYLVRENRKPEDRAMLWLVVDAGSILEDEDQLGLAHFLEHMAFNGTENFAKDDLIRYLQSIGMRFGADLNAGTGFDSTTYMLTVPTDDPEAMMTGFQILEDWAGGVLIEEEEVEKERGVVVSEWRLGLGAAERIRNRHLPVLLKDSLYAERLPIGEREVLETAPAEALRRFYRDWYRPDLMAVLAVGDFDGEQVAAIIRQRFADLAGPQQPRPRIEPPLPSHRETLIEVATDPELTFTSVSIYHKLPAQPEGSFADYRRGLIEALTLQMLNSRLDEIAQSPDAPFVYGGAGVSSFVRPVEMYQLAAGVKGDDVEGALAALLTEVERVERHGFTAGELERASLEVMRAFEQAYEERDKSESFRLIAELSRHFLNGEAVPGIAAELAMARHYLPQITLADVDAAARRWSGEENRVVLVAAPEREGAEPPAEAALAEVLTRVADSTIEPYEDRVADRPLMETPPEPGSITAEKTIPELGVTEWTLSNGARVVLKPTDFKNDEILLTATSPGGASLVDDERFTSARFADTLISEGGVADLDLVTLQKLLAGKVVQVAPFIGDLEEGLTGRTSNQDLETFFQLVHLTVTQPRVDENAYRSVMERLNAVLANRQASPETEFGDRLQKVLYQDHPRRQPLSLATLEEVDLEQAAAVYRDRFSDVSDFTFILVGSFEPAAVRPLVERYLASLPGGGREESWRDVGARTPAGVERFEVARGMEPRSRVQLVFNGEAPWSREQQHAILSLEAVVQDRVRETLREEMGGIYSAGVSGSLEARPLGRYAFNVGFSADPEQVEPLLAALFAEIEEIQRQGPHHEEVANIRREQRRSRETSLQQNRFWAGALETYYSLGLDPRLILAYDELVDGLSPEIIREAARTYLDDGRYVLGVLKPAAAPAEDAVGGGGSR